MTPDPESTPAISSSGSYWVLQTREMGYAFGLNPAGALVNAYWGQRLPRLEDYPELLSLPARSSFDHPLNQIPEEYPTVGGPKYTEPALQAIFGGGERDLALVFQRTEVSGEELIVTLRDQHYGLWVELHYRVWAEANLIERWVEVTNSDQEAVRLERIFSATLQLPPGRQYALTYLEGRWFDEFEQQRKPLEVGNLVLESKRITTGHDGSPWFALDAAESGDAASETEGGVWFGTLEWSGNWKLVAERTRFDRSAVHLGLNDWDFAWSLAVGETFRTPAVFFGFTNGGFGQMSRDLHDFVRGHLLPHGRQARPVLYNSWEATYFEVNEGGQMRLAELAAEMGVELFVVDDGWFAGRDRDNAGLGDWWPDPVKFPGGLGKLIAYVQTLGMEFGIWIEPEMVNPDSQLYRAHPDWTLHFPHRERSLMRDQLILNLARVDVQNHLIEVLDRLLSANPIRFIKWDMNRNVSEAGWPDYPGEPREVWVRYVQGLYRVWGELRARHPQVVWQTCSGGGGRVDFGTLRLADQAWVSDNTYAPARLQIQEGYSLVFPAVTMESWVTDRGAKQVPLEFRFHASMTGVLGVGGDLNEWSEEQRREATQHIRTYKSIRDIVHWGDLYRLRSPTQYPYSAVQYVSKDKSEGVVLAFRTHQGRTRDAPLLFLQGLEPEALYTVEGVTDGAGQQVVRSGAAWRVVGLRLELSDFRSALRRITRVNTLRGDGVGA